MLLAKNNLSFFSFERNESIKHIKKKKNKKTHLNYFYAQALPTMKQEVSEKKKLNTQPR